MQASVSNMKRAELKATEGQQKKIKCRFFEISILVTLISLVWSLLSLPVIFYHLNSIKTSIPKANKTDLSSNASECLNAVVYDSSDGGCKFEFLDALTESNCKGGSEQPILVQRDGQELIGQIVQGLEFLDASESCMTEATSFMCLYAYGLCSSSGKNIQPTSGQCEELRDTLCQSEWASAIELGVDLPDCDQFPESPKNCPESNSTDIIIATTERNTSGYNQSIRDTILNCSEFFFRENGSHFCVPNCYSWTPYKRKLYMGINAVVILMAAIGSISAITILIISCLKPKRMCKFPVVFVLYMVVDILIIESLILVSRVDKRILHCSSRNLLESLRVVTPFCTIAGLLFYYLLLQLAVWWFSHTAILFWKVFFPFQFLTFKASGRLKYVHIICATIGMLFPLVTVVTSMIKFGVESSNKADNTTSATELFLSGGLGYSGSFPSILCTASDEHAGFYSMILPICIMQAFGSSLLILSLWRIQRRSANKKSNSINLIYFGTAEKKLLLVFVYVEIILIVVLTTFTLNTRYQNEYKRSLFEFFTCEQSGHDPERPCSQSVIDRLGLPTANIISYIIAGWLPVVILVYAINVQEVKKALNSGKQKTYKCC